MPTGDNQPPRLDEHRFAAVRENVQFLLDSGMGIREICARMGVQKGSLDNAFRRAGLQPPWAPVREPGCDVCGKRTKYSLHPAKSGRARGKVCGWSCYEKWLASLLV